MRAVDHRRGTEQPAHRRDFLVDTEACRVDVELPSEFHHGEDVVILPAGRMRQDQIQPGACAQDGFHGLPIRPVVVWKGDSEIDDQRGPALLQRGQYFAARIQLVAVVHREHPRRLEPMLLQAAHNRVRGRQLSIRVRHDGPDRVQARICCCALLLNRPEQQFIPFRLAAELAGGVKQERFPDVVVVEFAQHILGGEERRPEDVLLDGQQPWTEDHVAIEEL